MVSTHDAVKIIKIIVPTYFTIKVQILFAKKYYSKLFKKRK